MSVKQMSLVWELDLAPNKRLVLLAYADHADEDGENVYPSLGRIAHKTGYSRDQVRRISRELEYDKLMEPVQQDNPDKNKPKRWRLTLGRGSKLQPFQPKKGGSKLLGGVANEPPPPGANDPPWAGAPVPPEPPLGTAIEPPNDSSSNDSESADKPPTEEEVKPQDLKQFAVAELMKRVSSARERGSPIHDPIDRDRAQYARFFATRSKIHDVETLLFVFDYMVRKASGEMEGEPKAWCGFDTALDFVLAGWRPENPVRDEEERRRILEENARAEAELLEGVLYNEPLPEERPSPGNIRRMMQEAANDLASADRGRSW